MITIEKPEVSDGFSVPTSSSRTGFYEDRNGNLYLVHGEGVSFIFETGNTNTAKYGENIVPLKKLPSGTKITITV